MKRIIFLILLTISSQVLAKKSEFTLCKSTFALCTTALCERISGKQDLVSCHCDVKKGYSVGQKACTGVKHSSRGEEISSRYYPIKSYAICTNHRPWAWCLDSPCLIDKKDPTKASCLCSMVKSKNYIIVTKTYTKNTCAIGIYSSATVKDATEVNDFLKGHKKKLAPFPITVVN